MYKNKNFMRSVAVLSLLFLLPCNQTHAAQLVEPMQSDSETTSNDIENMPVTETSEASESEESDSKAASNDTESMPVTETSEASIEDTPSETTDTFDGAQNAGESESDNDEDIPESSGLIDVYCPTDYPFLVYESETDGRRLTSQIFYIANRGPNDIIVDLSDVRLTPKEGVAFQELSNPIDQNYISDTKDIFAFFKVADIASDSQITDETFQSIDIPLEPVIPEEGDYILTGLEEKADYKINLKAANYDENGQFLSYNPESVFAFYIAGTVTPNKNLTWNRGDISINLNIKFNTVDDKATDKI